MKSHFSRVRARAVRARAAWMAGAVLGALAIHAAPAAADTVEYE
jgi:hypothetical protein